MITSIQRMSIHDGPGIRSTIFMKGCNLRCKWCHNPETFEFEVELEWISDKCIDCGVCVEACKTGALVNNTGKLQFDKSMCTACFDCTNVCFSEALHKVGRELSPEELFSEVEQDFPFFSESNGGVTISGGEPLLQLDFVREVLKLFKQAGIHTAIESNMTVAWDRYEAILPYTDMVMADIKIMDGELHKKWTGAGNEKILDNIRRLDETGIEYYLRTPVIPGVNHSIEEIEEIVEFVSKLKNIRKLELLPFHPLADSKYKNLGIANHFKDVRALSEKDLEQYYSLLIEKNIKFK